MEMLWKCYGSYVRTMGNYYGNIIWGIMGTLWNTMEYYGIYRDYGSYMLGEAGYKGNMMEYIDGNNGESSGTVEDYDGIFPYWKTFW